MSCETSSSWPEQSPRLPSPRPWGLPRLDQYLTCAMSPEKARRWLCYMPSTSSCCTTLSCPSAFCHTSSCIFSISWEKAVRSHCQVNLTHCQERVLFLICSLSLSLLNTSCAVCSYSIYLNLLQPRPIPNSGQKYNTEVMNVLETISEIQDPPHPGVSSHQHHPLTCFSSPQKKTWQKLNLLSDQKVRQTLNQKETKLQR